MEEGGEDETNKKPLAKGKAKAKAKGKSKAKGRPVKKQKQDDETEKKEDKEAEPPASAAHDVADDADLSAEEAEIKTELAVMETKEMQEEVKPNKRPRKTKASGSKDVPTAPDAPELPVNRNLEKEFQDVAEKKNGDVAETSPRHAPEKRDHQETIHLFLNTCQTN